MHDFLEFRVLERKLAFGGSNFFNKETKILLDVVTEKSLGIKCNHPKYKFITSQPVDNLGRRAYTTWEADISDPDYASVRMVGTYRFMSKEDAIDLMQRDINPYE